MNPYERPFASLGLVAALSFAACSTPSDEQPGARPIVTLSEAEDSAYRTDALRLTLRLLDHADDLNRHAPEIPTALSDSLYQALVLVQGSPGSARNRIVGIHTRAEPELHHILVKVDSTKEWVAAWRSLRTETGVPELDVLLGRYMLTVERYHAWPLGHWVALRATPPLNVAGLAVPLQEIDGILHVSPNYSYGDGNDIVAERGSNGWVLRYLVKWGDCPAGCINKHFWEFQVTFDGAVRFTGSGGDPLP
jgi:hypothetical protein